jgi:hypothetical protein
LNNQYCVFLLAEAYGGVTIMPHAEVFWDGSCGVGQLGILIGGFAGCNCGVVVSQGPSKCGRLVLRGT